jgi:hypothetical protein
MRYPRYIESAFVFPPFLKVQMNYPKDQLDDLEATLVPQLAKEIAAANILSGDTVAVGVGSRGIDRISDVVRIVCKCLLDTGAKPVIIPAMGSHGGATAEGQEALLASLGVTGETCSAPVKSAMETIQIGTAFDDASVYYAKDALEMDHSICINRIKPHTKFKAPLESGLVKMLCVGMGKHDGALSYHKYALKYGFFDLLKAMGTLLVNKTNLRFGVGIVENAYDKLMAAEVVPANLFLEKEPLLLKLAKKNFPSLPLKKLDALIIGKIGKEISGAGMDPNVTGRAFDLRESNFSKMMNATRVAILRLSEKSDGNALGVGNADFITEKLYQSMNYEKTIMNGLTSTSLHKAFIPIRLPTEEKAIQACFTTIGPTVPKNVRAVIIADTLHVSEFWASAALRSELEMISNAALSEEIFLNFDESGDLLEPGLY